MERSRASKAVSLMLRWEVATVSIIEALKEGSAIVPKDAMNAFVSDSASACKNAREGLIQDPDYYHVV